MAAPTVTISDNAIEYRLPAGGSVIYTDEIGTELFRVSSVGDAVKVNKIALDPLTLDELATLGGLTATAAELNKLAGVTAGTVLASKAVVVDANKDAAAFRTISATGLSLAGSSPVSHPIDLEGLTLPANSNAIRGASINPTRTSGWVSFSGTVAATPAQVYTDYRNLTTTGVAEVLGIGSFPMMASGASCASMFALQAICQVDTGATVLTAAAAPGVGIFPITAKLLLDGETFNSGGVAAAAFLSVQANVTDVSAQDTAMINMEIASGGIRSIFKVQDSASGGATYLLDFTDDLGKPCSLTNGSTLNDISATANAGWIAVRIGSTVRYIPLYDAKA